MEDEKRRTCRMHGVGKAGIQNLNLKALRGRDLLGHQAVHGEQCCNGTLKVGCGDVGWMQVIQGRLQWQLVMNMVTRK
jgi:hypothetical protein